MLKLEKGLCPKLIVKCSNKCQKQISWKFISKATGTLNTPDLLSTASNIFKISMMEEVLETPDDGYYPDSTDPLHFFLESINSWLEITNQ